MGKVAEIVVPPPEPFVEGDDGAEAIGAGYRFIAPRTATEPLVMEAADGSVFLWTPTELCYRDEHGNIDFIAGSAPVQLEVRGREARYRRTFPASDEVHIAQPEGRKYWLILYEPPRPPASYLQGEIWFGVSGMVRGVPLPPGIHQTIQAFAFGFKHPFAADLMAARTECWYEVVDTEDGQQLFIWCRAAWLLAEDRVYPIKMDPTITTTTTTYPFYPIWHNHVVTLEDGRKVALVATASSAIDLYVSADDGETWQKVSTYTGSASDERWMMRSGPAIHFIFGDQWVFKLTENNFSGTWMHLRTIIGPRIIVFPWWDEANSKWIALIIWDNGSSMYYRLYEARLNGTTNALTDQESLLRDTIYPVGVMLPDRTVWVFGRKGSSNWSLVCRKLTWNGSGYNLGNEETVLAAGSAASSATKVAVDKEGRLVIAYAGGDSPGAAIKVWRRSLSGTWENLGAPTSAQAPHYPDVAVVCKRNDIYVFYINSGLYMIKWTDADGAWTGPVVIDSDTTADDVTIEQNPTGDSALVLYRIGSSSPYTIKSYTIRFNQPPQQPANLTRANFDATEDAVFEWQHKDDPGDGQAKYQLQIRFAGADFDLVDTGEVQSPVSEYILPADTLTNGQSYQWRVRTADQSGEWSPWSEYAVFQTGPKPQATILYPTEGTTVSTAEVTVEWSVGSQSSATVRLYDEAGQTVLQEHEVTTPSARARTITGLQNNTSYQVSVQPVSTIGVTGDEVFSGPFDVAYTPPPKPTATAAGQAGFIRVTITNPAPAEGEPEVTHNDLYRREPGGAWVRIATGIEPGGTYDDYAVGSGVVYEYRARAVGANGTYTDSDPVQASVTYDEWRFSPVDGRPEIRFRFDSSVSWRPEEDVQVPRTQSRYRRTYRNPAFARVADIQARFRDGEDGLTVREQRERLLQYIEQGVVGWLRGPHGDCWRGVLLQSQVQPSPHFARETVACVFRETREAP